MVCVRHSCTCIPTDDHMWHRYANRVHVCSSFIRNFLWCLLIFRLPDERRTNMTKRVRPHLVNAHVRLCSVKHIHQVYTRLYPILLVKYLQNLKITSHFMYLVLHYNFSNFFAVFRISNLQFQFSQKLIFWNSKFKKWFLRPYMSYGLQVLDHSTRYNQHVMILY